MVFIIISFNIINRVTGALYGRLVGVAMVAIYESATGSAYPAGPEHAWLDPAIYAIMGAASILAGANRLAIASTVIVVSIDYLTTAVNWSIARQLINQRQIKPRD